MINRIFLILFFLFTLFLMAGCENENGIAFLAETIAIMTPSDSDAHFSYEEDIKVYLTKTTNSIIISWEANKEDDEVFWVARTEDCYLNDYEIISDKLGEGMREIIDLNVIEGKTYVYRVLRKCTKYRQFTDSNGHTRTESYTSYDMSGPVSINF